MVGLVASLTLLLVGCTPPPVQGGGDAPTGVTAHPEHSFLRTLGASSPLPTEGWGQLGRRIIEMEQVIEVAHFVTHQGCPDPETVAPELLTYYFTPEMTETFSAAAVCNRGNGDVLALLKPGHEAQFERAYRAVPDEYVGRWRQAVEQVRRESYLSPDYWGYHPLGVGNGFVVFKVLDAVGHNGEIDAWSMAGLEQLICDQGQPCRFD